ncbi:hypothetical protein ACHWQZ_G008742 [Mnemiopsis leidyi]
MLVQKGGTDIEISALGPKPDVVLPHYERNRGPSPEVAGQSSAEVQENRILFIQSEKPDIELPLYTRHDSPDYSRRLDWSANIRADSPDLQFEVVGVKSGVPHNLDWSAKIESQDPDKKAGPTHRMQSPESKVMEWSTDVYDYGRGQTVPPSPVVMPSKVMPSKVPTLTHTWTPKDDEGLKLDMQQDNVIHRINSMSMRRKTRKQNSLAATIRQKMFRKAEVVEHIPAKTGISKQTKRKSVRDEVEVNMMSVYRMLQQNKAREMEFSFRTETEPLPIVPPLAKEFYEEAQLVKTETGELAYELDEEESSLLRNCGKHPYLRRSETEPRALGLLGSPERTEFGTVIRRSGTICLPTSNQLSETELNSLAEFMGYKKMCQQERQYKTGEVSKIERRHSSVEQIVQLPKEECLIPTPPPSTPTPTPPPSPDEYTPMQYQYSVPGRKVEVAVEETVSSASRQYTEVITPPTVTPIPEEEEVEEEEMEDKARSEVVMKNRDTPSSMSFRGASRASHKSPSNLEIETKEQRSHSTVSSNSVCGKIVDEVLLRINFEKEENQIEREASSSVLKNLTYTIECVPTESEPSRSSVRSPSSSETEREAASTSSLLKYPTPIPSITVKEPTAAAGQLRAASFRSHSSASKSDMTIRSFGTQSRMSRVSNVSERRRVKIDLNPDSPYIIHHIDKNIAVQAAQEEVESSTAEAFRLENFMKYKKRLRKMSQKKRIEELTKENIRKTEITENVYLHGKFVPNNKLAPLTPPRSPVSSDTPASASPDEKEGFDDEKDRGLIKIIDQIRSLTNASIGEMKTYKSPPPDVHAVVKCVFMILGEDPKRLEHWQECVVLLSKLGRKHVRRRVLRMRKDRVTPQIRENAHKLLAGWTSYDIAQRSRVCVLFFIWCKEICDLNDRPEDNPLLPVVVGRFLNQQNNKAVMSRIFSNRNNYPGMLPGEENPRMVLAAARAFKMNRANKRNTLPPVVRTPASARTPA